MDGIQHYAAAPLRPQAVPASIASLNPAVVKSPSDYLRALRRRIWLVLAVGVPMSVGASVWAVRQAPVYRAVAQIQIEPPQYDPVLSTLVSHEVGRHDPEATEKYLPNRVAYLKSKALAEEVVNDPAFLQGGPPEPDAAEEFVNNLTTKINLNSNWVTVTLDGNDPARAAKQLSTLLEIFSRKIRDDAVNKNDASRSNAAESLANLQNELKGIDEKLVGMLRTTSTIGPGGTNIIQAQYENVGSMLKHKQIRLDEFQQQAGISQLFPREGALRPEDASRQNQVDKLMETRRRLTLQLQEFKRTIKDFNGDPSVKHTALKLDHVLAQIEELRSAPQRTRLDPSDTIVESMRREIESTEEAAKSLLGKLRESMPDHETFLSLKDERENKLKRIEEMKSKLWAFQMLTKSQSPPVTIYGSVQEPATPIRPKRGINIAIGIILSFALGIALVCLLEHVDHSVKVPEHLSIGLTLPLLGVVPRIRRTALTHRAGHLWTAGAPDSVEADAYRNLRASLLGSSDRLGPIVTLLITSAKAGEGKSTTALNLAATCARAGERTLLMDVDLRRPSLAELFEDGHELGLVDVLRGATPWQRTVVHTDSANLDFLPTGDARDVPIEILGTLELRQLLIGLANHYDRVILDGPAVLGMADCRMLGRLVDAAVLVVRSGSHEMRPLLRAKAMLEQSRVVIAGVVFNGLCEDLQNWSSYGPYQPYGQVEGPRGGLDAPDDEHAALPLAVGGR
jgi:polysaccharide biosynthesis transport protein